MGPSQDPGEHLMVCDVSEELGGLAEESVAEHITYHADLRQAEFQRQYRRFHRELPEIVAAPSTSLDRARLAGRFVSSTLVAGTPKSGALGPCLADLILGDLQMPNMDGAALYQELRLRYGPTMPPMIFVTAPSHSLDYARFLRAASLPVLSKPFTVDGLRKAGRLALGEGA